jgi:plasmid stabilization system protein ParE
MRLTYTDEALMELSDAVSYYRSRAAGLGLEFYQRVEVAEDEIIAHSEAWKNVGGPYRRRLLKQFPYGLIYHQQEPGWIEIVAVMHLHREQDYWRGSGA